MIQVDTLSGALLDYFTALAIGRDARILAPVPRSEGVAGTNIDAVCFAIVAGRVNWYEPFSPSTNWNDLGEFIEREGIHTLRYSGNMWEARHPFPHERMTGPTLRIAACRAMVAARFGSTVTYEWNLP